MTLYTETQGQGPDVVLVHGWGMNGEVWHDIVHALAPKYRVTTVDLPGHGRSVDSPRDYQLPALAAMLHEVVPAQATVVGWSLGGQVTTQLELDYPGTIGQLVLVASAPQFERSEDWPEGIEASILNKFAGDLRHDFKQTVMRFIAIQALGSEHAQQMQRTLRERVFMHGYPQIAALEGGLQLLHNVNLRPRMQELHCPVLLINGDRDTLFRVDAARRTSELIPDARLHIIKGAGHAPFISHPREFLQALSEFLEP
jgi:pimeloyl-[acyl-carrier protein] methyl ester esterase